MWNTHTSVQEDVDYAEELRDAGLLNMDDFARRMESLTLTHATLLDTDDNEEGGNVDRPWRELE